MEFLWPDARNDSGHPAVWPPDQRLHRGAEHCCRADAARDAGSLGGRPSPSLGTPATTPAALPPFRFSRKRGRLDWRVLHSVNIERLVREADIATLERVAGAITWGDLTADDIRAAGEASFGKAFRLAQLLAEYLLYVQETLLRENHRLEGERAAAAAHVDALRARLQDVISDAKQTKSEYRRARRTVRVLEAAAQARAAETSATPMAAATGAADGGGNAGRQQESAAALVTEVLKVVSQHTAIQLQPQHLTSSGDVLQTTAVAPAHLPAASGLPDGPSRREMEDMTERLSVALEEVERLRGEREELGYEVRRLRDALADQITALSTLHVCGGPATAVSPMPIAAAVADSAPAVVASGGVTDSAVPGAGAYVNELRQRAEVAERLLASESESVRAAKQQLESSLRRVESAEAAAESMRMLANRAAAEAESMRTELDAMRVAKQQAESRIEGLLKALEGGAADGRGAGTAVAAAAAVATSPGAGALSPAAAAWAEERRTLHHQLEAAQTAAALAVARLQAAEERLPSSKAETAPSAAPAQQSMHEAEGLSQVVMPTGAGTSGVVESQPHVGAASPAVEVAKNSPAAKSPARLQQPAAGRRAEAQDSPLAAGRPPAVLAPAPAVMTKRIPLPTPEAASALRAMVAQLSAAPPQELKDLPYVDDWDKPCLISDEEEALFTSLVPQGLKGSPAQDVNAVARAAAAAALNREVDAAAAALGVDPRRQGLRDLEFLAAMKLLEAQRTRDEETLTLEQRGEREALRYALALHAYNTTKSTQAAAPGGTLPLIPPVLVPAAAGPIPLAALTAGPATPGGMASPAAALRYQGVTEAFSEDESAAGGGGGGGGGLDRGSPQRMGAGGAWGSAAPQLRAAAAGSSRPSTPPPSAQHAPTDASLSPLRAALLARRQQLPLPQHTGSDASPGPARRVEMQQQFVQSMQEQMHASTGSGGVHTPTRFGQQQGAVMLEEQGVGTAAYGGITGEFGEP